MRVSIAVESKALVSSCLGGGESGWCFEAEQEEEEEEEVWGCGAKALVLCRSSCSI